MVQTSIDEISVSTFILRSCRFALLPTAQYNLNADTVRGPWGPMEDQIVRREIIKIGVEYVKWAHIAQKLPGRLGKQIRERWYNHLDPTLIRGVFSKDEDLLLSQLQKQYGNKWKQISKQMVGRSENMIKNRFNSTFFRAQVEILEKNRPASTVAVLVAKVERQHRPFAVANATEQPAKGIEVDNNAQHPPRVPAQLVPPPSVNSSVSSSSSLTLPLPPSIQLIGIEFVPPPSSTSSIPSFSSLPVAQHPPLLRVQPVPPPSLLSVQLMPPPLFNASVSSSSNLGIGASISLQHGLPLPPSMQLNGIQFLPPPPSSLLSSSSSSTASYLNPSIVHPGGVTYSPMSFLGSSCVPNNLGSVPLLTL